MNKNQFILCLFCLPSIISCANLKTEEENKVEAINTRPNTEISFENTKFELENVKRGELIECLYKFKNIGKNVLIIEYVNPDCICTSFEISSKEILPNQVGWIKLVLDTKDKLANTRINATVRTNTDEKFHKLVLMTSIID